MKVLTVVRNKGQLNDSPSYPSLRAERDDNVADIIRVS